MFNWFNHEPKQRPPEHALCIKMPKGATYLKLWRDDTKKRICMEFASKPGYFMVWDVRTLPQMIEKLGQLLAESPLPPVEESK